MVHPLLSMVASLWAAAVAAAMVDGSNGSNNILVGVLHVFGCVWRSHKHIRTHSNTFKHIQTHFEHIRTHPNTFRNMLLADEVSV